MDLTALIDEVGTTGAVAAVGSGSRRAARPGARPVRAPSGIESFQPDEMTVCCGAGTPVAELVAALGDHGQGVGLPVTGTVGGALAAGQSDIWRLGRGAVRDTLLQARYVSATGRLVTAGGPTVKNVSGFDLCRLLVGSWGSLGVLGEVILRTRPLPVVSRWFAGPAEDPFALPTRLFRPAAVLWDGTTTWVCLEGDPADVEEQARLAGLPEVAGPPELPTGGRWSWPPSALPSLGGSGERFVAELGVGVVHHERPPTPRPADPAVREVERRIKAELDPTDRFGPLPGH